VLAVINCQEKTLRSSRSTVPFSLGLPIIFQSIGNACGLATLNPRMGLQRIGRAVGDGLYDACVLPGIDRASVRLAYCAHTLVALLSMMVNFGAMRHDEIIVNTCGVPLESYLKAHGNNVEGLKLFCSRIKVNGVVITDAVNAFVEGAPGAMNLIAAVGDPCVLPTP
jgi:hypothetical protein